MYDDDPHAHSPPPIGREATQPEHHPTAGSVPPEPAEEERIELTETGEWLTEHVSICLDAGISYEQIWDGLESMMLTERAAIADTESHERPHSEDT